MKVVSLRVGMPRRVILGSGELLTGGAKAEVAEAMLRFAGFEGDQVADRLHHGGPDRAACAYPAAHYAWWKAEYGYDLPLGGFCENLTIEGLLEEEIRIGDTLRIGEALTQVSLPRDPCKTIDRLMGIPSLHRVARERGKCGFHMRALEEGRVRVGDSVELVERKAGGISVAAVLDLYHGRSKDGELQRRLEAMGEFAEEGKRELAKRLGPVLAVPPSPSAKRSPA
jgi:MOSC domain-containing protein YiiM